MTSPDPLVAVLQTLAASGAPWTAIVLLGIAWGCREIRRAIREAPAPAITIRIEPPKDPIPVALAAPRGPEH